MWWEDSAVCGGVVLVDALFCAVVFVVCVYAYTKICREGIISVGK